MSEVAMSKVDYPIVIYALSDEDGGGYMALAPDLQGCMGDGDTPESALSDLRNAILEWTDEATRLGRSIPEAGSRGARARAEREEITNLVDAQERVIEAQEVALSHAKHELEILRESVTGLIAHDNTGPRMTFWSTLDASVYVSTPTSRRRVGLTN